MDMKLDRRQLLKAGAVMAGLGATSRFAWAADTTLRMTWWGGVARADLTQKVLDIYLPANPGLKVDTEYLGWGDYWPRLSTMTAGGNSPDIVQMSITYLADYASRGVLLDLKPLIPGTLSVSGIPQDLLDNGSLDGKLYAVPCGVNAGALIINKALFEEAGVATPGFDTTWEDFAKLMADFTKATPKKGMYGSPDASGGGPVLETWLRQRGKQLYTAEGELGYDAADMTDWFEMWAEMRASGAIAPADVQALDHGDIDTSLMSQGRAAVNFENSNQYVGVRALTKDALLLAPYPKLGADGKGGLYLKPTMFYSVSSQSANAEAATTLVNFFLNDPDATAILGGERGIPASSEVRERLRPKMGPDDQVMLDYISNLGDHAGTLPPPAPAGGGEIDELLAKASESVAFGAQTPADGAATYIEDAQKVLSRAS